MCMWLRCRLGGKGLSFCNCLNEYSFREQLFRADMPQFEDCLNDQSFRQPPLQADTPQSRDSLNDRSFRESSRHPCCRQLARRASDGRLAAAPCCVGVELVRTPPSPSPTGLSRQRLRAPAPRRGGTLSLPMPLAGNDGLPRRRPPALLSKNLRITPCAGPRVRV